MFQANDEKTLNLKNEAKSKDIFSRMTTETKYVLRFFLKDSIEINLQNIQWILRLHCRKFKKIDQYELENKSRKIIDFLLNNDIIESDEGQQNEYYFTTFFDEYFKKLL